MSGFNTYIEKLNNQFLSGLAREHSYRPAFQNYLETLLPDARVTNEPKRTKVGAPDFIITMSFFFPILRGYFYIVNYQAAQKWLKDRVGRRLTY